MEDNIITLSIYGKKIESKDGKKWTKFSFTKDGSKFYDVKLLDQATKLSGYIKVTLHKSDVSVKSNKGKTNKNGYELNDVIFLKNIISIEEDTQRIKEIEKMKMEMLEEIF